MNPFLIINRYTPIFGVCACVLLVFFSAPVKAQEPNENRQFVVQAVPQQNMPMPPAAAPVMPAAPTAIQQVPSVPNQPPAPPVSEMPTQPIQPPPAQPLPAPTLNEPVSGAAAGGNYMGDTGAMVEQHSGQYFDSMALVPDSALAGAGITGPRKVDPKFEPGQRFVIVEKKAAASSYEGVFTAAQRALKLGRYAAAMEMFEELRKKNSRDVRVLMGLAIAQQGAGFKQSAIESYEDVLKVQPNNASAIINLMGLMKEQFPERTMARLQDLKRKYPGNPGVPAQMGLASAELKQYDVALRYFEMAASLEPLNPDHIYNMAIVMDRKGDANSAIKLYERALEMVSMQGDNQRTLPRDQIYDRLVTLRRGS